MEEDDLKTDNLDCAKTQAVEKLNTTVISSFIRSLGSNLDLKCDNNA
jgi:hypothetical protein